MRVGLIAALGFTGLAATPASAATIVVFTNPETMERKTVVVDQDVRTGSSCACSRPARPAAIK